VPEADPLPVPFPLPTPELLVEGEGFAKGVGLAPGVELCREAGVACGVEFVRESEPDVGDGLVRGVELGDNELLFAPFPSFDTIKSGVGRGLTEGEAEAPGVGFGEEADDRLVPVFVMEMGFDKSNGFVGSEASALVVPVVPLPRVFMASSATWFVPEGLEEASGVLSVSGAGLSAGLVGEPVGPLDGEGVLFKTANASARNFSRAASRAFSCSM